MTTRTTVYLDRRLYQAAKVKSAVTDRSLSDVINEALIASLREDKADLDAFEHRRKEPSRPFENVLRDLKKDGLL
jgi:hypothetical protein